MDKEEKHSLTKDHEKRINRVIDLIKEDPSRPFRLEDLAAEACFSPFHFHRIFAHAMGMTPSAFIRKMRIQKSLNILIHTKDISITDAALSSGFSSSANFSKAFKAVTGLSPRQCRNCGYDELVRKIGGQNDFPSPGERLNREGPDPSVRFESYGKRVFAYSRYHGAYNWKLGFHWGNFMRVLKKNDLLQGKPVLYGITYDNPDLDDPDKGIYDACIEVGKLVDDISEISCLTLDAGEYAVFPFRGEPEELHSLFSYIYGVWLDRERVSLADTPILQRIPGAPKGRILEFDIMIPVIRTP